jgi:hypothetical protein
MKKITFLGLLVCFFLCPSGSLAAFLDFQPSSFELTANPGDEITNVIRINNSSEEDIYLVPQVVDLHSDKLYSLADWTFFDQPQIKIASGAGTIVKFELKIPSSARPGGYFGGLVFRKKYADPNLQLTELGRSLLYLRVAGPVEQVVDLCGFETEKKFYQSGPVSFKLCLKNAGQLFWRPEGKVLLYNSFGQKVAELKLRENNLLPGESLETPLWWDRKLLWGKYRAVLTLTNGQTNVVSFWAFPFKIPALVLLGSGGIFILAVIYRDCKKKNR